MRAIRWFWAVVAVAFAVTAALEVYLAVTMAAAWSWALAGLFVLACVACATAALRRDRISPPRDPGI
ncbi:hypothetical protein GCM10027445_21790 [Amycolatopsis endophytica]|uniref:Uncharacterized protein n=1 Tax=Amycolatopsis endophytica TaxID=860233 RepID=A0A853BDJ2_9PSEU|nr:hypothetical protein [Amycolatopsis endophytica]NYI93443.1 hypothetical protein [Amycolatopsis endophytica]